MMNATACSSLRLQVPRCSHIRGMASRAPRNRRHKKKAVSPTPPSEAQSGASEPLYSSKVLPHSTLPPAKMRALISLYHQADTWVTPETLLDRIDQAFIHSQQPLGTMSTGSNTERTITMEEINNAKNAILEAPKMSKWDISAGAALAIRTEGNATSGSWANNRSVRERRVIEALYGVVAVSDDKKIMPGLEVVKEAQGWMAKAAEADKEEAIAQGHSQSN